MFSANLITVFRKAEILTKQYKNIIKKCFVIFAGSSISESGGQIAVAPVS